MDKYEQMSLEYECFAVFFVGGITLFYAFLATKLPNFCKAIVLITCGIVLFTISLSGRFNVYFINELRLQYQADSSALATYQKYYLGAGLLSYLGFIFAIFSVVGNGFNAPYKPAKIILALAMTACQIASMVLIGTSKSSNSSVIVQLQEIQAANLGTMAVLFWFWVVALNAALSGSKALAAATAVMFGLSGFYVLKMLLAINDALTQNFSDSASAQLQAGYVVGWFQCFCGLILAIPVYATSDTGSVSA